MFHISHLGVSDWDCALDNGTNKILIVVFGGVKSGIDQIQGFGFDTVFDDTANLFFKTLLTNALLKINRQIHRDNRKQNKRNSISFGK